MNNRTVGRELRRSPVEHAGRLPRFDLDAARALYTAIHWGDPVTDEFGAWGAGVPEVAAQIGTFEWAELAGGRRVKPETSGSVLLLTDRFGEGLYLASRSPAGIFGDFDGGAIKAVAYQTMKAGETWTWRHAFEGKLPRLLVDDDGQAYIDRGLSGFRVTWRGIVG